MVTGSSTLGFILKTVPTIQQMPIHKEDQMAEVKFYSLKSKKYVVIDSSKVKVVTFKNGRKAAEAVDPETGVKLYKFLSAEELKKLE
jgi:hypothetical protein